MLYLVLRRGCKRCLRDTTCLFFFFFLALWTLVSPPEVPPCTSNGGAAVGMSCGRKPVSLQEVLGKQAGQKSPGGCCNAPYRLRKGSLPPPKCHPCSVGQEGGGHGDREAGSTGRVCSRSGRDRQVPPGARRAGASFAAGLRDAGGSVKGAHRPSGFGCLLLPAAPCNASGGWAGTHLSLAGLPTPGSGGWGGFPHPGAVLDPGAGRGPQDCQFCPFIEGRKGSPGGEAVLPRQPSSLGPGRAAPRPRAWSRGQRCGRGRSGGEAPETHSLK